ncbi:SRP40, C-terminal domain-containing protein [Cubamyces menziesii]|nr:SRP40, C-terminal domain-containing protein [Cubamyces menziesii]
MVQPSKAKSASPARSSKTLSSDASDSDSDSDDSSSSDDDSDGDDEKKSKSKGTEAEKTETKKPKVKKTQESSSDSSSSDSSSSDSSSEDSDSSSSSESSDSDSDSEESDSDSDDEKEKKSETKAKAEAGKDEVKVTKKRRTDEDGASVPTAVTHNARESETPNKSQSATPKPDGKHNGNEKNGKKPRKSNTPFQRVKLEQVKFADERLKDNRFESRGASASDYGAKAARDLIVTRGAGFRKEKNKKKRGSYRGGEITMESHSIKFND